MTSRVISFRAPIRLRANSKLACFKFPLHARFQHGRLPERQTKYYQTGTKITSMLEFSIPLWAIFPLPCWSPRATKKLTVRGIKLRCNSLFARSSFSIGCKKKAFVRVQMCELILVLPSYFFTGVLSIFYVKKRNKFYLLSDQTGFVQCAVCSKCTKYWDRSGKGSQGRLLRPRLKNWRGCK